ncbi:MAG TPA: hypothetical protein PLF29_02370, partial [bacterium]|nr:hypothetical protein [bacterium]
ESYTRGLVLLEAMKKEPAASPTIWDTVKRVLCYYNIHLLHFSISEIVDNALYSYVVLSCSGQSCNSLKTFFKPGSTDVAGSGSELSSFVVPGPAFADKGGPEDLYKETHASASETAEILIDLVDGLCLSYQLNVPILLSPKVVEEAGIKITKELLESAINSS